MKRLYYLALFLHFIYTIILKNILEPEYNVFVTISWVVFAMTLLGFVYLKTRNKIFAYIAMIGFALMAPIGIIGLVALRNEMDNESKIKFLKELENERNNNA